MKRINSLGPRAVSRFVLFVIIASAPPLSVYPQAFADQSFTIMLNPSSVKAKISSLFTLEVTNAGGADDHLASFDVNIPQGFGDVSVGDVNAGEKNWVCALSDSVLKCNAQTDDDDIVGAGNVSVNFNALPESAGTLALDVVTYSDRESQSPIQNSLQVFVDVITDAAKLAYISGASQTLNIESISEEITVQVQDQSGNPVNADTDLVVSLSSTSAGGEFSEDANFTPVNSVTIATGSSSISFFYRDNAIGNPVLTVSASDLVSAADTFTITGAESQNNAPDLLNPGDKTVDMLNAVYFTLSANDPDADQNLTFTITDGLQSGMELNSSGEFVWTPDEEQQPGTYTVTFTVTDSGSPPLSDSETVVIVVNEPQPEVDIPVNSAPIANAGADRTFYEGQIVTLNAAGSSDADAQTLTYSWVQTAGPPVVLSDPRSPAPTFVAPPVAVMTTLTFVVTASDGQASSEDSVNINVDNIVGYHYAPSLNATDSFLELLDAPSLRLQTFSVAAWFKTYADYSREAMIVNKGGIGSETPGTNMNYGIWLTSTERVQGGFETQEGINKFVTSPNAYSDGNWHYAVVTFDGASLKLYIDGVLVTTGTTSSMPDDTGNQPLRIGVNSRGLNRFFDGSIDEARVWNRAITTEEITNHYSFGMFDVNGQIVHLDMTKIPVPLEQGENGLTVTKRIGDINEGNTVELEFENNELEGATLDAIVLTPAVDVFNVNLDLLVSNTVPEELRQPVTEGALLFTEVNFSGEGADFGDTSTYRENPRIIFEVDKDEVCGELELFLFNELIGQWIPLQNSVSLIETTDLKCIYEGTVPHFSTFAIGPTGGGGVGNVGSGGGGGPATMLVDTKEPSIVNYYWNPEVPSAGRNLTITVNMGDDVGIKSATIFYSNSEEKRADAQSVSMRKLNSQWFTVDIPGSSVREPEISFWIVGVDMSGNSAESDMRSIEVREGIQLPEAKASQKNLPVHVRDMIKPRVVPVEKLEVLSMKNGDSIDAFSDSIVIRNAGSVPVNNIRIMLSPEISRSFILGETAIKSIDPNGNVTVSIAMNGNPNRDMMGGLMGYKGNVMVMAEHHSPILLPVSIGAQKSSYISEYMEKVASMAELRYSKVSLLNSILSKDDESARNYEVTTTDGKNVITSPDGEIVIRNLGERELQNVRIYFSNAGHTFLLDRNNIQYLEPDSEMTIKLIPMMNVAKYSKDISGELLIVPSNDIPVQLPIRIVGSERNNSAGEYEVKTLNGNTISNAAESIMIKNNGSRTMDSVKVMLSSNLGRVFSLSKSSFSSIESGEEVSVNLHYNSADLRTFMHNQNGELYVVSEHHAMRSIPVEMEWKSISSTHFTIYTRTDDQNRGKEVIDVLEENYGKMMERFVENDRTAMYMVSMEEMKLISESGDPFYSYTNDVIFICSCNAERDALRLFAYKLVIDSNPSYHNREKIFFDNGNWLVDGLATYIVAEALGEAMNTHDLSGLQLEWYGPGTEQQRNLSYTFLKYLSEVYGEQVIDGIVRYLGSGQISNHRCYTLESCAVMQAVHAGHDKNLTNFDDIVSAWEEYMHTRNV